MNLEQQIESILFFKNEPISLKELSATLKVSQEDLQSAISNLQKEYRDRGIVIIANSDKYGLGTHPENSSLIEAIQKEELSRELGRAGFETLAIVTYKGPVSRREIDQIRGVNSGFVLRNLLIRGLVERIDPSNDPSLLFKAGRSFTYQPTLKLFEYLAITKREELPEYNEAFKKMTQFVTEIDETKN